MNADINLNPQLAARLRAVSQYWGHDNLSETMALILDAATNKWEIPVPHTPAIAMDKAARVRLRARHLVYFEQMSQLSGLSVPELARSVLIQWLCIPQNTRMLPPMVETLPQKVQPLPQTTRKPPKQVKSSPKKREQSPQNIGVSPQTAEVLSQDVDESPQPTPTSTKTTGRSALSGLLSKK